MGPFQGTSLRLEIYQHIKNKYRKIIELIQPLLETNSF